ncbi:serine/threonine-protein kinase pim-2-like [Chaetodon trifascialis]|uniref:serine/threonine-protein kinase pim-2-like n=1 Tax=Chaetodon trifascialis TaxID=109706 RepID=UPI00399475F2
MSSQRRGNTTAEDSQVSVEDTRIQHGKRKASADGEAPKKKSRHSIYTISSSDPSVVLVEDTRIQHGKRKASADGEAPNKKFRRSIYTISSSDPSVVLVEDTRIQHGKRKASVDDEPPKKKKRCSPESFIHQPSTSISQNTTSPLTEEERIFEMSSIKNISRGDFQDKYCQLAELGAGGFGSVFSGFRKSDKLPVAIKHIPCRTVRSETVSCNGKEFHIILEVAFMLKAAGLPGSVGQSAAVSLLDWYIRGEKLTLVMERPNSSMDLDSYLRYRGGSLSEKEAKFILRQLVDAAIDMHSKGIFHRDIKLQNVLVQLDSGLPRVRIIDFGCASFSSEMTFTSFCGTHLFFPPEWFSHRAYKACPTTVYQLGALFYLLLEGHPYFSTRHFFSECIHINRALSADVKILLYRCLTREPTLRATLEELQSFSALRHLRP